MQTIVLLRTGGIGDVILSTVALNVLNTQLPAATVHWFGRQPTLDLIAAAFPSVIVHELPPGAGYRENMGIMRRAVSGVDVVIDLQRSARTLILGLLCALRGGGRYVTWNKFSVRRSAMVARAALRRRTHCMQTTQLPRRHEAMAACVLRAVSGGRSGSMQQIESGYVPRLNLPQLPAEDAVAINLGSLYPAKELPYDHWSTLVRSIAAQRLCRRLHFLGDARKEADATRLCAVAASAGLEPVNWCGRTSLVEAAQILAACRYTLSNDSALAHLSESVGTPVTTFFGPTHEGFGYRPFLKQSQSVSSPLSCRPCTKGGNASCRFDDFRCFRDLDVQPALTHLRRILAPAVA